MRSSSLLVTCLLAAAATNMTSAADVPEFPLGPDSQRKADVPRGTVKKFTFRSEVFVTTVREWWLYIPHESHLKPDAELAVMVFQDGHTYVSETGEFRVPIVFDNLIHEGSIPPLVGIFINPGHKDAAPPENPWRANNRSVEYDTLSDDYARFLINEMLPAAEKESGRKLTTDPEQRAICGISSGGICAFTVAWQRPDAFRKVLSHVGSFTNIRGGHVYPTLIRKTNPAKPLRVFLEDGENDLDNEHGNWWLSNLQMAKALAFKKYDYQFVGSLGAHNGKHGGQILPESLRWLWRKANTEMPSAANAQPAK